MAKVCDNLLHLLPLLNFVKMNWYVMIFNLILMILMVFSKPSVYMLQNEAFKIFVTSYDVTYVT